MSRWGRLAEEVREEMKAPPPTPLDLLKQRNRKKKPHKLTPRESVMVRWESVREEREQWLAPFYKLPIERAMAYLEDLRKICEQAGYVMNDRVSKDTNNMRCACGCGADLSGTKPSGLPKWIKKMDLKDKRHPEIWHSLFFAQAICVELWTRRQQASCKCGHLRSDHGVALSDLSCSHQDCQCRKYQIADRMALQPTGVIT